MNSKNKNIIIIMVAFCATVFLDACSKDKEVEKAKVTYVTQKITGAGDCIHCDGWSWSNGEAVTTKNTSKDTCSFSFKTTIAGELSFSRRFTSSNQYAFLKVNIGEKTYFQKNETGYYSDGPSSIGMVKEGEIVTFLGRKYAVKGIQIIGEQIIDTKDNPSDPQWDF